MKWSRLFWIFVLAGAVLIGGTAWLSAHRLSPPGVRTAKEESATADLGSTRARMGARQTMSDGTRPSDAPAVAAGDRVAPSLSPSGAEGQPSVAARDAGLPGPADDRAFDADGAAAPRPHAHPKDVPRVNPTSGELMWSAHDVIPDGGRPDEPLCGGKTCRPGQFCCGPPACGRCAYPMAGPRCPSVCPEQKSN